MGNVSGADIGKGQANIGRGLSGLNVTLSKIGAVFLVIFGIVFIVLAFVPLSSQKNLPCRKDEDCPVGKCGEKGECLTPVDTPKEKHGWFIIIGIVMFLLAGFTVWYSQFLYDYAQKGDAEAQAVGLLSEASLLNSVFQR